MPRIGRVASVGVAVLCGVALALVLSGPVAPADAAPIDPTVGQTAVTKVIGASIVLTLSPTPTPKVTGPTRVGSRLTAVPGAWGPAPVRLSYQWAVGNVAVPGATSSTFVIPRSAAGNRVTVSVTGVKLGYAPVSKTSAAIIPLGGSALTATPVPRVTGSPKVGSTLTATPGTWSPAPVSLGYQWFVGNAPVFGATSRTFVIPPFAVGKTVTVSVAGSKTGYTSVTKSSAATPPITASALTSTPVPSIAGTAAVGSTLTASPGTWSPAPVRLAYQWYVAGVAQSGATSKTLVVPSSAAGKTVTVSVTGFKPGYATVTKTSVPTATVTLPGVVHVSSDITADSTWVSTAVYVVESTVTVAPDATLTIEAGTVIKFAWSPLSIDGTLVVNGTSAKPVIFTSLLDDTAGGDTNNDGSETEPAGDDDCFGIQGYGPVDVDWAEFRCGSLTDYSLATASVRNSSFDDGGIRLDAGDVTISGNTVVGSPGTGIEVYQGLNETAISPIVSGNTVSNSSGAAIKVSSLHLDGAKLAGNTGSGNGSDSIALAGQISVDTTWSTAGDELALVIRSASEWFRGVTVPEGVTLTLDAGTVVKFQRGTWCGGCGDPMITAPTLDVFGSLIIDGTAADPVILTSMLDDSVAGDTNGDGSATSPSAFNWGGFTGHGPIDINEAEFRFAGVDSSGDVASITDSTFYQAGISLSGPDVTVTGNTITEAPGVGIRVSQGLRDPTVAPVISDNVVAEAEDTAIWISSFHLEGANLEGNTGWGNNGDTILLSGEISADTTWTPLPGALVPVIRSTSEGFRGLTVQDGVTLTVGAGMVVKFQRGSWCQGCSDPTIASAFLDVYGALVVEGTSEDPVAFTSMADDTIGGDTKNDGDETTPYLRDWLGVTLIGGELTATHFEARYAETSVSASSSTVEIDDSSLSGYLTCLNLDGLSGGHFHGSVHDCDTGVSAVTFFDATDVAWGNDAGPGADGNPTATGPYLTVFPWVGAALPAPITTPITTVPATDAGTCSSYLFIGMMGSGQASEAGNSDHLGSQVRKVYDGFTQAWVNDPEGAEDATFMKVGIDYEANPVPIVGTSGANAWESLKAVANYVPGAWDGSVRLIKQLEAAVEECGAAGQRIVVAGYSQGAWAVHAALNYLAAAQSPLLDHIVGVALLADPLRYHGLDITNTGIGEPGDGVAATFIGFAGTAYMDWIKSSALADIPGVEDVQMSDFSYPGELASDSVQLCTMGDAVCDTSSFLGFPRVFDLGYWFSEGATIHGGYATTELRELGAQLRFIALAAP